MVEIHTSGTVFQFFFDVWYVSFMFHMVMYLPMWMTRFGRFVDFLEG